MEIKRLIVGFLQTNCYVLSKNNKSLIVDPGDDFEYIKNNISNEVLAVLITHSHMDHVGALNKLEEYYKCPVYNFNNIKENKLMLDKFNINIIHNPGHSSDSVSFLIENNLFCGDFIFEGTIGRTDFPTGSMLDMQHSIKNILEYPDDMLIYPGHGDATTLKKERPSLIKFL